MATKSVGPKGQILIPKRMREAIGIKPGIDVILEIREGEIVISKPKIEGNYTEYYTTTNSPKIKRPIKIKEIINEEACNRHALS